MKRYTGRLTDFFETGCEGSYWVLERFDKTGYEALIFLDEGDDLTIYDESGEFVYHGVIHKDLEANLRQRPLSEFKQPVSCGHWVHWLQSGVDPDVWGHWFFSEKYTAVLLRR